MDNETKTVLQRGLTFHFGEDVVTVKPQTMARALEWRETVEPILSTLFGDAGDIQSPEDLKDALRGSPKDMVKVVASYCEMEEDVLINKANPVQVVAAFNMIMGEALLSFIAMQNFKRDAFDSKNREQILHPSGTSST